MYEHHSECPEVTCYFCVQQREVMPPFPDHFIFYLFGVSCLRHILMIYSSFVINTPKINFLVMKNLPKDSLQVQIYFISFKLSILYNKLIW